MEVLRDWLRPWYPLLSCGVQAGGSRFGCQAIVFAYILHEVLSRFISPCGVRGWFRFSWHFFEYYVIYVVLCVVVLVSLGIAFYFSDSCVFVLEAESSEMTQARGLVLEQVYGQEKTALSKWSWIIVSIDEEDLLPVILWSLC